MTSALDWFSAQVGAEALDKMLLTFVEQFPGISVMRGEETPLEWLAGQPMARRTGPPRWKSLLLLVDCQPQRGFSALRGAFRGKDPGREDRLPPGDASSFPSTLPRAR
jgi:hypothetical protein